MVLAKTSPVTYKIQHDARADPEFMHVDKLLPYQADFEEELYSWLHDEESAGQQVAEMHTTDNMPSELPPEAAVCSPSPTQGGSLDFGLVSDQDADVESDVEEPSTSVIQPRRGIRPRQNPDRYASGSSVWSVPGLSNDSSFSTPILMGLLLAASTLSRCETSSGCRGVHQQLGEYTNTPPSVSGEVALVDPVVGGSPLLTESLLNLAVLQYCPAVVRLTVP